MSKMLGVVLLDGCCTCEFAWEHRAGKSHTNADALFRVGTSDSVLGVFHQLSSIAYIKAAQTAEKVLSPIIAALNSDAPLPPDVAPGLRRVVLEDVVLCRGFLL